MIPNDYVSFKKLTDTLYVIQERIGEPYFNTFVITGKDKTVVIDSGFGIYGNIRKYIEKNIAEKTPMPCYLTHGDLDHIGGAVLFDEAYLNRNDYPDLDSNMSIERRWLDLERLTDDPEIMAYAKEHYTPNDGLAFKELEDGTIIDYGDGCLEVFWLPGHTPGSVVFYNRAENYILTGDSITENNSCRGGKAGMLECIGKLKDLKGNISDNTVRYGAHDAVLAPLAEISEQIPSTGKLLDKIIDAFLEVLDGKTENDEEFVRRNGPGLKAAGKTMLHRSGIITIRYTI